MAKLGIKLVYSIHTTGSFDSTIIHMYAKFWSVHLCRYMYFYDKNLGRDGLLLLKACTSASLHAW